MDRCSLLEFPEDGTELLTTHQWANEGVPSSSGRLVSEETPWYSRMLQRGETVAYSAPADLPDEAVRDTEFWARTGLRSNLTIPLKVSGRGLGALVIGASAASEHGQPSSFRGFASWERCLPMPWCAGTNRSVSSKLWPRSRS